MKRTPTKTVLLHATLNNCCRLLSVYLSSSPLLLVVRVRQRSSLLHQNSHSVITGSIITKQLGSESI